MTKMLLTSATYFLAVNIGLFSSFSQAAENKLTSTEIRNLTFSSNAVLKSRQHMKSRIVEQTKSDRLALQAIQNSIKGLDRKFKQGNFSNTNIVPHSTLIVNGVDITNSTRKKSNIKLKDSSDQTTNSLATEREKYISNAIANIDKTIAKAESEQTPRWQFWKDRTKNDKRKEHMVKALLATKEQLVLLENDTNTDIHEIKIAFDKLALKKSAIKIKAMGDAPTISTRTKHRRQGVSK